MRVGVQGQPGSACDEAASLFMPDPSITFDYLTNADRTLAALSAGRIERAVLALESPVGAPVAETAEALKKYTDLVILNELHREVHHCIMVHPNYSGEKIRGVASHEIPLLKHKEFLEHRFPGYQPIVLADPGFAAQQLAEGSLSLNTAVVAMPRAAQLFGLKILENTLPANNNYLTRFVVVQAL